MDERSPTSATHHIGQAIRELRASRRWSQAALAQRLDMSQGRLSRIERGEGSLWAEELLTVLALFNVGLDRFLPGLDDERSLQNALARFGASHLREHPDVVVRDSHSSPEEVVVGVLARPSSERFVTALAPVLVASADQVSLPAIQHQLARAGVPNRLGWLVENTVAAIDAQDLADAAGRRSLARARTWLRTFLEAVEPDETLSGGAWDAFDVGVRSSQTQREVRANASTISKRWRIESRLQPGDFVESLRSARDADR